MTETRLQLKAAAATAALTPLSGGWLVAGSGDDEFMQAAHARCRRKYGPEVGINSCNLRDSGRVRPGRHHDPSSPTMRPRKLL
jgi:hypothetical protein